MVVVKVVIAEWSKENRGWIHRPPPQSFLTGDHPSDSELTSPVSY